MADLGHTSGDDSRNPRAIYVNCPLKRHGPDLMAWRSWARPFIQTLACLSGLHEGYKALLDFDSPDHHQRFLFTSCIIHRSPLFTGNASQGIKGTAPAWRSIRCYTPTRDMPIDERLQPKMPGICLSASCQSSHLSHFVDITSRTWSQNYGLPLPPPQPNPTGARLHVGMILALFTTAISKLETWLWQQGNLTPDGLT
jgi:hypothetical protein